MQRCEKKLESTQRNHYEDQHKYPQYTNLQYPLAHLLVATPAFQALLKLNHPLDCLLC